MGCLRFRTAGVRVDLVWRDGETLTLVAQVGEAMLDAAPNEAAAVRVIVDESTVAGPVSTDPERAAAQLLSAVEQAALRATPTLAVHGAALAGGAGAVVVPGASGAGKSTLAAAAVQAGLTLLSDEAACFVEPLGTVIPHPRPVALSRVSRQLLDLADLDEPDEEIALAGQIFGTVAEPGSQHRCVGIVLPEWGAGHEASLEPVDRSVGLDALLSCRFGGAEATWSMEHAWDYLSRLAADASCVRLRYDDPRSGAALLARSLG